MKKTLNRAIHVPLLSKSLHCNGETFSFAFLSLAFTVRVHRENFTESCVGDWLWWWPRGFLCSVVFCVSALLTWASIMFTAVGEQGGDSCLLVLFLFALGYFSTFGILCLFCIWYLLIFQLSETKLVFFLENYSVEYMFFYNNGSILQFGYRN